MKNVINTLASMVILLLSLGLAFLGGRYYEKNVIQEIINAEEIVSETENQGEIDLELPGEVEKRVVTISDVESKLSEIGELSTFLDEYTVTLGKDETRHFLDNIKIPWTKNSIEITCTGIIKIGYNMSDIKVRIDDYKIYIVIPEAKINDNYVIWDTIECTEKNNFTNPIEFSQYQELIDEMEAMGLEDAEKNGVYERAKENLKYVINIFLSEFADYEIEYL